MGMICGVSYNGDSGLDPKSMTWYYTAWIGELNENPNSDSHTISLDPNSLYIVMVLNDTTIALSNAALIRATDGTSYIDFGYTPWNNQYGDRISTYIVRTGDANGSITLESGHIRAVKIFDPNA